LACCKKKPTAQVDAVNLQVPKTEASKNSRAQRMTEEEKLHFLALNDQYRNDIFGEGKTAEDHRKKRETWILVT